MLLIFIAGLCALLAHVCVVCWCWNLSAPPTGTLFQMWVHTNLIYGACECVCDCVWACVWLSVCVCVSVCVCDLITHLYCAAVKSKAGESLGAKQMPGLSLHTLCCSTGVYMVNFSCVWISALHTLPYGIAYTYVDARLYTTQRHWQECAVHLYSILYGSATQIWMQLKFTVCVFNDQDLYRHVYAGAMCIIKGA